FLVLGVALMCGMLCYFLVKFLFQVRTNDMKGKVQVFATEHPQLFAFIDKLCEETGAPKTKKVIISPNVNAAVYYNSSFLSLFLPVNKNLEIGAALLNCINLTEFKAVLAHEFGHFSQSSTILGSYIYRFNHVVHNLLFENEGWSKTVDNLSSWNGVLRI